MKQIKKISELLLPVLIEMLLFSFKTIQQVKLPSTKTKGNILSTFFIFFVGTVERISCLKSYLLNIPFLKPKQIRQVVLMAGLLLFLLSLVEQSARKVSEKIIFSEITKLASRQMGRSITISKESRVKNVSIFLVQQLSSHRIPLSNILPFFGVKHFIFIHSFRI